MPVATDAVTSLWRAVVVLRILTGAFIIGSSIVGGFVRSDSGWLVLAAIVVWTAVICLAYSYDLTRRIHVIVLDLLVTLSLPAAWVLLLPPEQLSAGTVVLTTVWYSGPVLAAAVHAGRIAGLMFGAVVCVVDLWALGFSSAPGNAAGNGAAELVGDMVLLVGTGYILGLAATTARRATEQLRMAARIEAVAAERKRLTRSVQDLAGSDDVDLAAALRLLAGSRVEVAVPAAEVPLPACDVEELVAVTREVLADSARRAGPDTKALVLVEDLGEEVVLTVRDEEPGSAEVRLAEANGRAGAPRSIRGRVADLGATLTLDTGSGQGTEWEVRLARVPRATVDE